MTKMKPILFNTEMVRAILDGRKVATRRVVKPQHLRVLNSPYRKTHPEISDKVLLEKLCRPPYIPGDILYVRETWQHLYIPNRVYIYKADSDGREDLATRWKGDWRPSIHMPKNAARIFLRVTDVRVERLQEITEDDLARDFGFCLDAINAVGRDDLAVPFWNSTIKKADRGLYGWFSNPYVWVIEFERCEKPQE